MKNKIAILIIGKQNSGKTTTIIFFDKVYNRDEKLKKYCRIGWRHLQLFKGKLHALFSLIYFIPSSPTETQRSLKKRLGKMRPEFILMAEQINGSEYQNTIDFLTNNDYEIIEFYINRNNSKEIWCEWDNKNMNEILEKRAIEIGNEFRNFILKIIK